MDKQDMKWIATRVIFVVVAGLVSRVFSSDTAVLHPETKVAAETDESNAVFFPQATGKIKEGIALKDAPDGGSGIFMGRDAQVEVGGIVSNGILGGKYYWASIVSATGQTQYGFVPEESVIVTSGHVPDLLYNAAPKEAWLAPATSNIAQETVVDTDVGEDPPVIAQTASLVTIPWLPDSVLQHSERISAAAQAANVDPDLVAIIVTVESGGSPTAGSSVGATGLMQLMPGTARDMATKVGMQYFDAAQMKDVDTNLKLGSTYLASMLKMFGSKDDPDYQQSVEMAAAAYNGGPGHVGQHLTTGQPLFAETRSYQRWVGGMWHERHDAESPTYNAWLAAGGQRLVDQATAQMEQEKVSMSSN